MKLKYQFIASIIFQFMFLSCLKDGGKDCWQALSPLGGDLFSSPLCNITKKEAEERYPGYWFYRAGETKFCWRADKPGDSQYPQYMWGIPESMKSNLENAWHYSLTKIDCSSFCFIIWIEKNKSKITGNYGQAHQYVETLPSGDSCSKLYIGRVVIYRETTDSLITREVSDKKP